MAYTSLNKLDKFIKAQKDHLPPGSQSNVVYKINCKDCETSYVGQTVQYTLCDLSILSNRRDRFPSSKSIFSSLAPFSSLIFAWQQASVQRRVSTSECVDFDRQLNGFPRRSRAPRPQLITIHPPRRTDVSEHFHISCRQLLYPASARLQFLLKVS